VRKDLLVAALGLHLLGELLERVECQLVEESLDGLDGKIGFFGRGLRFPRRLGLENVVRLEIFDAVVVVALIFCLAL